MKTSTSIFGGWRKEKKKSMHMENSNCVFPDDIIFEILLLLPLESLVRFSCVCKLWRNFITSDEVFIRSRLARTMDKEDQHEILMYSNRRYGDEEVEECFQNYDSPATDDRIMKSRKSIELSNPLYIGENFYMAGCCNGLVCYYNPFSQIIHLWNPALHQCWTLPTSRETYMWMRYSDFVVFGYDPQDRDFKVVTVQMEEMKVELYSLKRNSWKQIVLEHSNDNRLANALDLRSDHPPLSFKGCLHWIGEVSFTERAERENNFSIVVFDICDEKLSLLTTPTSVSKTWGSFPCLGVLEGCLSFISSVNYNELVVWSMKTYGDPNSWMKAFVIDSSSVPIGFSVSSGKVLLLEELHSVFSYDNKSGMFSKQFDLCGNRSRFDQCFIAEYVESLFSPVSSQPEPSHSPPEEEKDGFCACFGLVMLFVALFLFYTTIFIAASS